MENTVIVSEQNYNVVVDEQNNLTVEIAQASVGPVGYTGSKGDIGYVGSQGPAGFTGSVGAQGATGFTGSGGYTGSSGSIGYTGSAGYVGSQGIQGETGYVGSQGPSGYVGSTGPVGYTGSVGFTGSSGNIGYTGSTGPQGPTGLTGSVGAQGPIGYTGSQGTLATFRFLIDKTSTDTAADNVANGYMRFNQPFPSTATSIAFASQDVNGAFITNYIGYFIHLGVVLNDWSTIFFRDANGNQIEAFIYFTNDTTSLGSGGIILGTVSSVGIGSTGWLDTATEVYVDFNIPQKGEIGYTGSAGGGSSNPVVITPTFATSMTVNVGGADVVRITLTDNLTLGFSGAVDGQKFIVELKQDGSGSHTLSYDTMVRFGTDIISTTLSTTAGKTDKVGFIYNATDAKYDVIAFAKGY